MSILKKIFLLFFLASLIKAQFTEEWTSSQVGYFTTTGWISFEYNGFEWENRIYSLDTNFFKIMQSGYNQIEQYSYTFSQAEKDAGYEIYSLGYDLTGDNITEFYVLSFYGTTDLYRQGFKIFDITNGLTIFQKDDEANYYTYPTFWDADNDGVLECSFYSYDFPSFFGYSIQIYSTNISTTKVQSEPVQISFKVEQNYPNPFNPSTTINYSINSPGTIGIKIFDIKGELIKSISKEHQHIGNFQYVWDGKNSQGTDVSSGAYFYQIKNGEKLETKKMMLLR